VQRDAVGREPRHLVRVVEAVDEQVPALEHRPVTSSVPVTACCAPDTRIGLGHGLCRRSSAFDGHAAVEGALTADEVVLDDRDRQAGVAEAARCDLPARPGSYDDDVVLRL
jgi:hypothetical protein